jgi:hypothetical protein
VAKSQNARGLVGRIVSFVVGTYLFGAFAVFTPYFNWLYAKEHGFTKWLLLGEIVPTAQALAWPYYAFSPPAGPITHLSKAINYNNQATEIGNKSKPYAEISQEDLAAMIRYSKLSLREAKRINITYLNNRLPGFGDHLKDLFIKGLEMRIKSFESANALMSVAADAMLYSWGDWYNANKEGLSKR